MLVKCEKNILDLEVSKWGRFIVYIVNMKCSNGGGNSCTFSRKEPAIKWAKEEATRWGMKWHNFPDPEKKYPYDDRDGSNDGLTPVFVAIWYYGSVSARIEVVRTEVCDVV
jgi:hypothetical protein